MEYNSSLTQEEVIAEQQRFMIKVYTWMSVALAVTGFVAMWIASQGEILKALFITNRWMIFGLIIVQFVLVGSLVGWINKMKANIATLIFIGYSVVTGIVLSSIFVVFTSESIASTFFITAGTFAVMSFLGYTTKTDLTKFGSIMIMALIGLVIASIVNIFLNSSTLYWITTYAGVLIFTGLIAYDTQKIKEMNIIGNEGTEDDKKEAIMGALTLYLDFINLFLFLLRIFGNRK